MPMGFYDPRSPACFWSRLVCLTQLRVSGMSLCVRRGAAHPGCLAAVVLSGAGGGGSITQELSHNQNSSLAGNSAQRRCSMVVFGHFPLSVAHSICSSRPTLKKNPAGSPKHYGVSR